MCVAGPAPNWSRSRRRSGNEAAAAREPERPYGLVDQAPPRGWAPPGPMGWHLGLVPSPLRGLGDTGGASLHTHMDWQTRRHQGAGPHLDRWGGIWGLSPHPYVDWVTLEGLPSTPVWTGRPGATKGLTPHLERQRSSNKGVLLHLPLSQGGTPGCYRGRTGRGDHLTWVDGVTLEEEHPHLHTRTGITEQTPFPPPPSCRDPPFCGAS